MSQIYSNLNMIHKRLFNEREYKKKRLEHGPVLARLASCESFFWPFSNLVVCVVFGKVIGFILKGRCQQILTSSII